MDERRQLERIGEQMARMLDGSTAGAFPIRIAAEEHEQLGRHVAAACVAAGWTLTRDGYALRAKEPPMLCRYCGQQTMHAGDVCYGCAQAVPV